MAACESECSKDARDTEGVVKLINAATGFDRFSAIAATSSVGATAA
jgi:hypothetical protein